MRLPNSTLDSSRYCGRCSDGGSDEQIAHPSPRLQLSRLHEHHKLLGRERSGQQLRRKLLYLESESENAIVGAKPGQHNAAFSWCCASSKSSLPESIGSAHMKMCEGALLEAP
jgi:hypothetical protein